MKETVQISQIILVVMGMVLGFAWGTLAITWLAPKDAPALQFMCRNLLADK